MNGNYIRQQNFQNVPIAAKKQFFPGILDTSYVDTYTYYIYIKLNTHTYIHTHNIYKLMSPITILSILTHDYIHNRFTNILAYPTLFRQCIGIAYLCIIIIPITNVYKRRYALTTVCLFAG